MKLSRRKFIASTAMASAAWLIPRFLQAAGRQLTGCFSGNRLVIIQLSGGNDGLNTVVPYQDDLYYRLRPVLSLPSDQLIPINDQAAWNGALLPLHRLYENGQVAILNRVGYPNPDLSHFRSMDIWHSASGSEQTLTTGWIGRYLDAVCQQGKAHTAMEFDDTLSMVMKGEHSSGLALNHPENFYRLTRTVFKNHQAHNPTRNETLDYLYKVMADASESAEIISRMSRQRQVSGSYPANEFGRDLKTIASLILSGLDTIFYYVSLSGFDTHVNQLNRHNQLLKTLADGLAAFCQDLKQGNEFNNTIIMVFSEFGRRVKENASRGTDHGAANVMLLLGGALKQPGLFNPMPDLSQLEAGNLSYEIDFHAIYATVLDRWLKTDAEKIIGKKFESLPVI
jgi:uncharacterized protein (DUF1501 family)